MKSIFNLPRFSAISIAVALLILLAACGQTGPLYLPANPGTAATPAHRQAPAPSPPVPAPVGAPVPASP